MCCVTKANTPLVLCSALFPDIQYTFEHSILRLGSLNNIIIFVCDSEATCNLLYHYNLIAVYPDYVLMFFLRYARIDVY